ncbi:MAG: O-antigen ligase family protein [Anaerosomatales bacterium]|nr:O-antigen ligase family protein [Anaerosomatales bacterium]
MSQASTIPGLRPAAWFGQCAALALALGSMFVSVQSAGDPYQPARTLVVALGALVALASVKDNRGAGRLVGAWLAAAGLLLGWSLLSAVTNGLASAVWGVHGRFDGLVAWAAAVGMGLAGAQLGDARAKDLARLAGVAAVVQSAVVVSQALGGAVPSGTAGNQVIAGGWLAVCVVLAAAGATAERGPWRALLAAAAAAGGLGLGLAGSRGAWVGVVTGLGVLAYARRARLATVLFAGVVASILVGAVVAGGESAEKLVPSQLSQGSAVARLEIWRGSAALIADRPLLGAGPGRFLYVFPRYETVEHARVEGSDVRADQAHSRPLHLAAESGVPAAAAWFTAFGMAGIAGLAGVRRRSAHALVLVSGLAAYVGQALFSVHAIEVDGLGWMIAGMLVGSVAVEGPRASGARVQRAVRGATALLAAVVVVLSARNLAADVAYQRSVERFQNGEMPAALDLAERAVRLDPLTDVYRVAYADAAAYLGPDERAAASAIIAAGLRLEPESYDLALSRARLLRLEGSPEVVEAFMSAAALYPNGVEVRREAIAACVQAGRLDEAKRLAAEILRVVPDDLEAAAVLGSGAP